MIRNVWGIVYRKDGTIVIDGFKHEKNGDSIVVHHIAGAKKGGRSVLRVAPNGEQFFLCRKQRVYLSDCVRA